MTAASASDFDRHSLTTRFVHGGLALSILSQLATSAVMAGPHGGAPGDWLFDLHKLGGYSALGFATLFWVIVVTRRRGTAFGRLFPWFGATGRRRFATDLSRHLAALRRGRLPHPQADEAEGSLAAAVHGLGLALMTLMALTGLGAIAAPGLAGGLLLVHSAAGNLVWAYLFGHAGLAALHHWLGHLNVGAMWSARRPTAG